MTVQAYKDIALNNTQAIKNSENGAELYSTTGNISVMSSTFNENTYNGLLASTQAAGATIYVYKSFGVGNTGGNGFLFNGVPSADITIECSEFTSDLTPDINIANAGGSTTLLGVTYGTSVITGA
ncbi:hypothetical protein JZU69_06380, partial [bacterium]|nr:hypothetical protein [bacterium]